MKMRLLKHWVMSCMVPLLYNTVNVPNPNNWPTSLSLIRDPCLSIYLDKKMQSSCYCECRFLNSISIPQKKKGEKKNAD
jgi:hypothetical protein